MEYAKSGTSDGATTLYQELAPEEQEIVSGLTTPFEIQLFLDRVAYSAEAFYRCPLRVLRDRCAHCFDGALFGAAMLRRLGYPPLILEMLPNDRDDDHLLAVYREEGLWGAVAKSNFVGLRFRDPVYRTLRELLMSYFEQYFNVEGEKTLRGYTLPLNLAEFDRLAWMVSDRPLEQIADRLDRVRRCRLLPDSAEGLLSPVDERSYRAGLAGSDPQGLYRPSSQGTEPKSE